MRQHVAVLLSLFVTMNIGAWAEQWPTNNILFRVLFIKVGDSYGTAFTIEHGGKQYLVTARHMVKNLPTKDATIKINVKGQWEAFVGDLILPAQEGVDIAVFTLAHDLTPRFEIDLDASVAFGQEGYFFGYPHGWHSEVNGGYVAFVKRASISAVPQTQNGVRFFYLDGFNNPGFSGGPVAFYNYKTSKWSILAVISGFEQEAAKKRAGTEYVDTDTLVNSGVIVAYPLGYAIEALDKYTAQTN